MAFEGKSYVTGGSPELKSPDLLALLCFSCLVFEISGGWLPQTRGRLQHPSPGLRIQWDKWQFPLVLLVILNACNKKSLNCLVSSPGDTATNKTEFTSLSKIDENYSISKHCAFCLWGHRETGHHLALEVPVHNGPTYSINLFTKVPRLN